MEKFQAALISDGKLQIAIIAIDKKTVDNQDLMHKMIQFFKTNIFKEAEIALMYLNTDKKPMYYGKKEIVQFLYKQLWKQLPWKEYELGKNVVF
jgi:hypothetical protein